jgi:3-methyladenine DNA glycosylase AlkD
MVTVIEILKILNDNADPTQLKGMSRYGMSVDKRLGVSIPVLRALAKLTGKDHKLANDLWQTEIDEAKILASMIDNPAELTEQQMDEWVKDFNSWDICDQVCMNLFEKAPFARKKIYDWSYREEEFVKRAAYALIACLAWHDKKAEDEQFIEMLPVVVYGATDERNFVKKAVSWALRHIGKRNQNLNAAAIETANNLLKMESKSARWIANDALKDLQRESVQKKFKKSDKPKRLFLPGKS